MKFSIITPTYKRPNELMRAIKSVLEQDYINWEMIIINDSPDFNYSSIENSNILKDERIKYFKNKENMGVNYSRNFALENISPDSDYIIFLDDDDYLNKDAIEKINLELKKENINWLTTNRVKENLETITNIKPKYKNKKDFSYFCDYLIFKNISGDATHIIKKDIATKYKFSEKIKNGEEWFFFIQIPFYIIYRNINSTISGGYLEGGLTDELKNKYKKNTKILWKEILNNKKYLFNFKILTIILLRKIKSLIEYY